MRFAFYSCMSGIAWGGSEELWYLAARQLQDQGHEIVVNYKWWEEKAKQLAELESHGAEITYRNSPRKRSGWGWVDSLRRFAPNTSVKPNQWLTQNPPDLLLVTAGYHTDAMPIVGICHRREIPYAINVQCASHSAFLHDRRVDAFREVYGNAAKVFFVSDENREKLETNLAMNLPNAEIIANPFSVSLDERPTWPESESPMRLACVGRIHFVSKGQDLIVDVLRQEKWRKRDLKIVIYGRDQGNERQLRDLVKLHGLENQIEFGGFATSISNMWSENHGLILPSRYEGAALTVVEAMMCHRMAVTTDTGRNVELIDDAKSGFIAPAPTAKLLDEALERAWNDRDRWREMGIQAGQDIRNRFCNDPVTDLVNRLSALASEKQERLESVRAD